ncbi:DUF6701 domain-containing protein [Pseudomonas sp. MAC6]|uniref:DUF6701 domain-containing protein n=1 Tax=Pseudomonas sp. MAC6 TaxID=3401633 RepID=UPI003BF5D77F
MNMYLRCVVVGLLLFSGNALAVNYTLPSATFSPCQGTWTAGSNTCSGQISFASGDTLTSSSALTLSADGGFALRGNTIGTASNPITLQASYNQITTIAPHSATTINGNVRNGSAAITLTNVTINGFIETASGSVTLTNSSVSGNVTGTGNGSLSTTNVGGNVSFTNGLSVTGGTLSGSASTNGNASFTNTTVIGAATATNGITASNSNFSGTITATNGVSSFSGGTINANINGNCCKITISGAYVTGNISSSNELEINNSTITGTVSNSNTITLNNSTVYGNVTGGGWNSSISGTGSSKVYGTCSPSVTTPSNLCDGSPISSCFTDSFDRASLGTDNWAVTSRNGSFGVPRTVGNRMRLTDNTGNVATGATLQRLLPATGNFVQVQFKYYAYNGNGADGVAVIFSDASITPQPGGYGGSLGYAQLNGTSGFAGGWLGIALDEYGNFSNPTETRIGGPGLRRDSVSIRGSGSGTSNYPYLAGTAANLNPGVDVSGATPGPGHIYRITLDSRTTGSTLVSVERNTGSGFSTLIAPFNAMANANQAALPSDFFVSLTGSTGGSNNIHELDDFQVCATRINPIGQQIDHFEFSYAGQALTCNPQPVTVKACLNASCSSLYTDPVSVTLSPTTGWSAVAPATLSGGNVVNFSGGSAALQLRSGAGQVVIGETTSLPAARPLTQRVCSTSGCRITFSDSGFLLNVPHMVAGKPVAATIQAVRKADNAAVCVPGFANVTRTVGFNAVYDNPATGTRAVVVNGVSVATAPASPPSTTPPTGISLSFDANGRATPNLQVRYDDAGLMTLAASYTDTTANPGSSGHRMVGSTQFIARPVGLCVYSDTANSECVAGDASCSKFVAAGDPFRLRVGGVAWQSDTDSDLCTGNLKTPNYQQVGMPLQPAIILSHALIAPSGGSPGSLGETAFDIVAADAGEKIFTTQSISEVGVFTITATPPTSYLGGPGVGNSDGSVDNSREVVSTSANIGRFYPASFLLDDPSVSPACNNFTYAGLVGKVGPPLQLAKTGQPFSVSGGLSARNRAGDVTTNYVGSFVKLLGSGIVYTDSGDKGVIAFGSSNMSADPAANKRGYLNYVTTNMTYSFNELREPYRMATQVAATDSDGVTGSVVDKVPNPVTGEPDEQQLPDFRVGQARIGNAHGSELENLALPFSVAYFDGNGFAPNPLDSCTEFTPAELEDYQRSGTGNGSPALVDQPYKALAGRGEYILTAPGENSAGSQWVTFGNPAPEWLQFDWSEDGVLDNPSGLATFGIYKGAAPLIFRREVYR